MEGKDRDPIYSERTEFGRMGDVGNNWGLRGTAIVPGIQVLQLGID